MVLDDGRPGKPVCICAAGVPAKITELEYQKLLHGLMKQFRPDIIADERPGHWGRIFIGMSQSRDDALATAAAQALQIPLRRFEPRRVKMLVAANGRASKQDVGQAVSALVRMPAGEHSEHVTDAAAIALVALKGSSRGQRGRR